MAALRKRWVPVMALLLCLALAGYGGWKVHKRMHPVWQITQYACESGNNASFYSIWNPEDGTLILVDSGWPQNAQTVRNVIERHGGHVKAWILTHYHADHIGAFNEVWPEYRSKTEKVYVTPLDWETFEPAAQSWDAPETFALFLEQTADADQIQFLNRGDSLSIGNLHLSVYNAFDEHVQELAKDIVNNASLAFRVTGEKDSMFFCGDMSDPALGQYLLDTYGAEALKSEYVQAAHHGNWGQKPEFYEALQPSTLFFDAPQWLMTGEQYDARLLKEWCLTQNIQVLDFTSAPNTIEFR